MNGTRLQNVRQCLTLINKTGEGLRLGYGYGGVSTSPPVTNVARQDLRAIVQRLLPQSFLQFREMGAGKALLIIALQGLSQSHVPAYRGPPRMKTDIEYQIK